MLKKILFLIIIITSPTLADEAEDKAEFKKLYAEFNDLYANSEDIDKIIKLGEELYILAPKAYGKNHLNTANVTYNLAKIYDKKGGTERNSDEKKAAELYEEYFKILEKLKTPYDHEFLNRYLDFVKAEYNANTYKSKKKYSKNLLKILNNISLSNEEKANIYSVIAQQQYSRRSFKNASKSFSFAKDLYSKIDGNESPKVGEMYYWLARCDTSRKKTNDAIRNYDAAINILEKSEDENEILMTLTAYKAMVQIYSIKKQADKATPYLLAYAYKRPNNNKQLRDPIYKFSPDTPKAVQRKKRGETITIVIEFDVDETGFTTNIYASSSNNKSVEKIAINAVKRYRYAPVIVNGNPQKMNTFQETFVYTKQ